MLFENKTVLVTGGGGGIGRASALAFAHEGANVMIADVDEDSGRETVRAVEAKNGRAQFIYADVSRSRDVEAMVNTTVESFGSLDCAFNNAGIDGEFGPLPQGTEENFDRVIAVNLKSVWLCMKYEISVMRRQGGGAIVNTGSTVGLTGFRTLSVYGAAKQGVAGLTKAAALECSRQAIRVNAVCPGVTRTPMIAAYAEAHPEADAALSEQAPIGRMAYPEEVAEATLWLCSDRASYITGVILSVDGGVMCQSGSFPPMPAP
jgi:NAD(P)-dependent dehydrogenase (short-subunit alcohol dehydrogenase family)